MTTPTDLPAVYRRAIEVLRENGWHQGSLVAESGDRPARECPVCMAGAIGIALADDPMTFKTDDPVVLTPLVGVIDTTGLAVNDGLGMAPLRLVGLWNDVPSRTFEQVADALERAAVAAESGGAE